MAEQTSEQAEQPKPRRGKAADDEPTLTPAEEQERRIRRAEENLEH
jgi:hypothetical protein